MLKTEKKLTKENNELTMRVLADGIQQGLGEIQQGQMPKQIIGPIIRPIVNGTLNAALIKTLFPFSLDRISLDIRNPRNVEKNPRTFVDNTASTQLSIPVLEAFAKALFEYANIHRAEYDASLASTAEFERAYNIAANFVNADSYQEIIFGRNTTEMINLVMRSMADEFRNGDNIVITRLEHNSNYVPWYGLQRMLRRRGIDIGIRIVDFHPRYGGLNYEQFGEHVSSRTKLVSVTGASNFMGTKPDLKKIAGIAKNNGYRQPRGNNGAYFLVDAAQLVPCCPVDVQELGCDFLAWSFHKMSLPLGLGGLYARKEVIEGLDPFLYGGDMILDVKEGAVEYKDLPWRYTAGTPNILGTIASGHGLEFLVNLGLGNIIDPVLRDVRGAIKEQKDAAREQEYTTKDQKDATKDPHENKHEKELYDYLVSRLGRQIEACILLNTPRGDFEHRYNVPAEYENEWREYSSKNPDLIAALRNPMQRLELSRSIVKTAMGNIRTHEKTLTQLAIDGLLKIKDVIIYGPKDASQRVGLVAFNINGLDPQMVAFELNKRGVEARNGNHCASLAHQYVGIEGSVRFSFYVYNDRNDVEKAVSAVKDIVAMGG